MWIVLSLSSTRFYFSANFCVEMVFLSSYDMFVLIFICSIIVIFFDFSANLSNLGEFKT